MRAPFHSAFAADFEAFLVFKRALGYPYRRGEETLRALDRYLARRRCTRVAQLPPHLLDWLARFPGRKPVSVACELAVVRQFHAYLGRAGRKGVPPVRWPVQPATSQYTPHVLSVAQVKRLLRLASRLHRPDFRGPLYRTLLLVLYCTGLRFGEALALRLGEVDARAGVLFVRESKGRSRWVPLHPSLTRQLRHYLKARRTYGRAGPQDFLFVNTRAGRLPVSTASQTVRGLLRAAGLKPTSGRSGPRPYDLRHTFAVHRLTRWYRQRANLHARLPWLSAYMGHTDVLGTETYLTATPELLALTARRFRYRYLHAPRPT